MKQFWRRLPRWLRISCGSLSLVCLLTLLLVGYGWWYFHPSIKRTDGVTYGQRHGKPLTMDVLRPARPNGLAVAAIVSGGWKSGGPGEAPAPLVAPLLRAGYTVFAICHISQPEASVMEIIEDCHRGIRFVRHHADQYGVDPDRIGVTGGSAGGHLSLMLATTGGPGSEDADDPVERESSAVQAVAIFYPVTDLLNMGDSTENLGDGGPPKSYTKSFGPGIEQPKRWQLVAKQCSPIYHVHPKMPPTLIFHGDADTLTPLDQSQRFCAAASEAGTEVDLVVHPGGGHGWLTLPLDFVEFADWFDRHL